MGNNNDDEFPPKLPRQMPRRQFLQFSVRSGLIAITGLSALFGVGKCSHDASTRQSTARLTPTANGYDFELAYAKGGLRAKHIYIYNDGIGVETHNGTRLRYDIDPDTIPPDGVLRILYFDDKRKNIEGAEITIQDCGIPNILLQERPTQYFLTTGGKTKVTLGNNMSSRLSISAGTANYPSNAEISGVSKEFIAKTKQQITISAIGEALENFQYMEALAEMGDPTRNAPYLYQEKKADTEIKTKNLSINLSIRDQDITLISKDQTDKLNVKSFAQAERQKYSDTTREELSALLQQHQKHAARMDATPFGPGRTP
jgi:hypothetical protein